MKALLCFIFIGFLYFAVDATQGPCPTNSDFEITLSAYDISDTYVAIQWETKCCINNYLFSRPCTSYSAAYPFTILYWKPGDTYSKSFSGTSQFDPTTDYAMFGIGNLVPNSDYIVQLNLNTGTLTFYPQVSFKTFSSPPISCDTVAATSFFGLYRAYERYSISYAYPYCGSWQTVAIQQNAAEGDYGVAVWNQASKVMILTFRGTVLSQSVDVIDNVDCDPKFPITQGETGTLCTSFFPQGCNGGILFCGFVDDANRAIPFASNALLSAIEKGAERFIVTGHSQGAAISILIATYLKQTLASDVKIDIQLVYFASPRVGDTTFVSYFSNLFAEKYIGYGTYYKSNGGDYIYDPVTLIPTGYEYMPAAQIYGYEADKNAIIGLDELGLHSGNTYFSETYLRYAGRQTVPFDLLYNVQYPLVSGCVPKCNGNTCGNDGCGGSCGSCPNNGLCNAGKCCVPNCQGKQCGDNGCGGSCGVCTTNSFCSSQSQCVVGCSPQCGTTKNCGPDLCGGSCGTCSSGFICNTNQQCFDVSNVLEIFYDCINNLGGEQSTENLVKCLEKLSLDQYGLVVARPLIKKRETLDQTIANALNVDPEVVLVILDTPERVDVAFLSTPDFGSGQVLAAKFVDLVNRNQFPNTNLTGLTAQLAVYITTNTTTNNDENNAPPVGNDGNAAPPPPSYLSPISSVFQIPSQESIESSNPPSIGMKFTPSEGSGIVPGFLFSFFICIFFILF